MTTTFTITPLDLGAVRREKSFFTYMQDVGTKIDLVVVSFLLRSDRHTVLVDTGGPAPAATPAWHLPYDQRPDQSLRRQLEEHDVDAAEVDAVIYTHLHWDHAYNQEILTGARFFVSERELRFALEPCPIQDRMYDAPSTGATPSFAAVDFEFTDPERELLGGLRVVPTPGHSPGHQSIVVPTADGPAVLAGDLAPLHENWERQVPNGMLHDLEDCFRSFARLEALGARVIPSHDPRLLGRDTNPSPSP
jgi:glyoxylase-like metal-dependent hydrolase (beta-lactamase superfamily II)